MTSIGIIMTPANQPSGNPAHADVDWNLTVVVDAATYVDVVVCEPAGAATRGIDDPHDFEITGMNSR